MNTEVVNALSQLTSGKTILYPTDTVWGLGCDATNTAAVSEIFQLKNRAESKSLVVLVSSIEMLNKYIQDIPEKAIQIIKTSENPTTVIYQNPKGFASNTVASDNTIAIRIPKHHFCLELINQFGKPIVSTSANVSGEPTPKSFSEISQPILEGVDYIVNLERDNITDKSSTILKLNGDEIEVIRA
tara:strand:- start:7796 stop:8353 length:558 start_codon:yes stop_codon:yes gene_type:complete